MQKLISKYGLAAHLALLAVAPLLVFPFLDVSASSKVILWLALLAFAWFLNAPSRINKERSTSEARRRITQGIVTDPIFWVLGVTTLISGISALNNGIHLAYNAEEYLWYMTEAYVSVLPASSEGAGFPVFVSAIIVLIVYLIARHALGKSARFASVYSVGLLASIGGLLAHYELMTGNETVVGLAKCSIENPAYVGIGFGIVLVLSLGAMPAIFERRWNVLIATLPIVFGGLIASLLTFSPAYMSIAYLSVASVVVAYGIFWAFKKLGKSTALKMLVIFVVSIFVALILVYGTSFNFVMDRFASLVSGFLPAAEQEVSSKLTAISMKVWKTKLWLGSGLGTFPQMLRFNASEEDWMAISIGQLTPLNGWSYLLLERGIVGALVIVVPAVALLWGYISRCITSIKELPSPLVLVGPLVAILVFTLNIYNVAMFRIEAIPLLVLAVALSTNSWAKEKHDGQ